MLNLTITSVDKILFEGEVVSVTAPGAGGELTVLAHHMPLVTTLKKGSIVLREPKEEEKTFPIETGILEVHKEGAVILL